MLTLIRHTIVCILRSPGILVWTLAFPLILSSIFSFMFAGLDEIFENQIVSFAVVEDEGYREAESFQTFLEEVEIADGTANEEAEESGFDVLPTASEAEARQLVDDGTAVAYVTVGDDGMPRMAVTSYADARSQTDRSIVRALLDRYRIAHAEASLLTEAALDGTAVNPDIAADAFSGSAVSTEDAAVLRVEPDSYSRYYYAVLGMACIMGAAIALTNVSRTRANCSDLGARRQVSATSPARQLAATIVASWACTLACLLVAFAFMRWIVGIEFGSREGLAVAALACCALAATGFGALIGALPLSLNTKTGVNTAAACLLSVCAGLYGEPAMELADWLSAHAPLLQTVNPAVQVSQVFYDLAYYDSLEPFAGTMLTLTAMAAIFFLAAGVLMRRQSYARL